MVLDEDKKIKDILMEMTKKLLQLFFLKAENSIFKVLIERLCQSEQIVFLFGVLKLLPQAFVTIQMPFYYKMLNSKWDNAEYCVSKKNFS